MRRSNKCGNRKITVNGITYDSKKEYKRHQTLMLLEKAGEITDLQRQVRFNLIPAQYETVETGELYKIGAKKGQPKTKQICVEKAVDYVADFVYTENGKQIVEDVKGYRNPSTSVYAYFVTKRKLMLYIHGIKVREV